MVEVCGWERDLSHDPPVHQHIGPDHQRVEEADSIPFKTACEKAWAELSQRRSLAPDEQ